MNSAEIADILREMYYSAPAGEKVAHIHLFGIRYASELESANIGSVVAQAGLQASYVTEVNKGKNLAKYVNVIQPL